MGNIKDNIKNIISPYRVEWVQKESDEFSASLFVEPLSRGFGHTIGNCIRRIMLSSLRGSSVIGFKLNNHSNFQCMRGSIQSIEEISLILRNLNIKIYSDEVVKLSISGKKKTSVSTDDITSQSKFEILESKKIFDLYEESEIDMDIYIKNHFGYLNEKEIQEYLPQENVIIIDNYFCPIKSFSFSVDEIKVNQKINYDKLLLSRSTNG